MHISHWFGIFLIIALVGSIHFTIFRLNGLFQKSKALMNMAEPYSRTGTGPRALFLGDSTALGVGTADPWLSVAGRFGSDHLDWSVETNAKSGRKVHELIPILQTLPDKKYQILVIQIGGNDILRFSRVEKVTADIRTVLHEASRVSQNIVLMSTGDVGRAPFLPRPFAPLWTKQTLAVRDALMTAAHETNTAYVDLYIADRNVDPFFTEPKKYHAADFLHPSADGYGLWYEKLKEKLPES